MEEDWGVRDGMGARITDINQSLLLVGVFHTALVLILYSKNMILVRLRLIPLYPEGISYFQHHRSCIVSSFLGSLCSYILKPLRRSTFH